MDEGNTYILGQKPCFPEINPLNLTFVGCVPNFDGWIMLNPYFWSHMLCLMVFFRAHVASKLDSHGVRNGEEDCGIFIAPLARGRWLHLWVDMESDNPDAFLRFRDVSYAWFSSKCWQKNMGKHPKPEWKNSNDQFSQVQAGLQAGVMVGSDVTTLTIAIYWPYLPN